MHILRAAVAIGGSPEARDAEAASFDTGTDLTLRWDNTLKLSAIDQLHPVSGAGYGYCAGAAPSSDYGDSGQPACGYQAGFISGRIDWLSELAADYQDYGILVSSAAWYDAIDQTPKPDRGADPSELGGRAIELFDAFAHGATTVGEDQKLSFSLGRQVSLWGESVYFPENGIAGGQAPIDTYRIQGSGTYQSRDAFLPVGQGVFDFQATSDFTLAGYYQFEWRRSRINPEDAYAGATDVLGAQGNSLISLTPPGGNAVVYRRRQDQSPGSSDQFGLAAKLQRGSFDFGLYGVSFNAKTPEIVIYRDAAASSDYHAVETYRLAYPKGIELYGVSAAGPLGDATFGAEISARRNMPLVNGGLLAPLPYGRTLFPTGDTLHGLFSWNTEMPPLSFLPGGAVWTGEIAANDLIGAVSNPQSVTPRRTRAAAGLRTIFEARFFQVLPRVDISVPVGLGYNFYGLSAVDPTMNRGTGDVSLGVSATVDQQWKLAVSYTRYFGLYKNDLSPFTTVRPATPLSDWNAIGATLERTF